MKLAASNIGWERPVDDRVAGLMTGLGFEGVEIAPGTYLPDVVNAMAADVRKVRDAWVNRQLPIVSLQALLFGHPELLIFGDAATRTRTRDYLAAVIRIGGELGARALVFGSPGNRRIGEMDIEEANAIAIDFFHDLGEVAVQHGTVLCIEPNPTEYGCDFIQTASEGQDLVRRVESDGFRLHLDAAGMTMSHETVGSELRNAMRHSHHFHASEVSLGPLGSGTVDHTTFAGELRESGYGGWVSMEMRSIAEDLQLLGLEAALRCVRDAYGD